MNLPNFTDAYLGVLAVLGVYGVHRVSLLLRFRWAESPKSAPVLRCAGDGRGSRDGQVHDKWTSKSHGLQHKKKPLEVKPRGTPAGQPRVEGGVVGRSMAGAQVPFITVQLPLFNERTVAERLIHSIAALRWPRDRIEIQVLDDSTDETRECVDRASREHAAAGVPIRVIRRSDRLGYKAGALAHGLTSARGDLVAIFDADFQPPEDFLERVIPSFDDPGVGMVQARWEHLNREESLLTRAQSTLLDGHFVIEHKVRADSGLFFNFNGTAGVWRRTAIEEAGGWQHDTLTEDLDLSYRAQLAGWKFVYLSRVGAPAEVPCTISSFKSQQHRWARGSIQVARKLGPSILRAKIPLRNKVEAAAHLTSNVGHPLILLLALLLPLGVDRAARISGLWYLGLFFMTTVSVLIFYETSQRALGRSRRSRLRDVPSAVILGIGICVSQTRAVLEGCSRETGEFVRTPKRGDPSTTKGYRSVFVGIPGIELCLSLWFVWGCVNAIERGAWMLLPFMLLFLLSFTWVGGLSLRDWARKGG